MPSPAFSVRPCLPGDATTLGALGARLFRQSYGVSHPEPHLTPYLDRTFASAKLAEELARPTVRAWFAQDTDEVPIAYAYVRFSAPPFPEGLPGQKPAEVLRFYVDEAWHGRGVGSALMRNCETAARGWGADCLWVAVWQQARGPIAFYQRTGLVVSGTTKFHFGDRQDDDFIMSRPLYPPDSAP